MAASCPRHWRNNINQPTLDRQLRDETLNVLFDRIVRLTTWSSLGYVTVTLTFDQDLTRVLAPAIVAVGAPLSQFMHRHTGNSRLAFAVYVWFIWSAIAIQSLVRGGVLNAALHFNIVLILVCGWLLGLRQALCLLGASVGCIALLTMAETQHWWVSLPRSEGLGYWIPMASAWGIGFLVMRQVLLVHERSLDEVRALNLTLQEKVQALEQQEQTTRMTERKVTQLLAASPLPITVTSFVTGTYVDVNPAWERFFQYLKADVLGKTSVDLGFWHDMSERQGFIDRFSGDGRVSGYEVSFVMRDGNTRDFMLSSERFFYGEEDCVLTMSVDVTERRRLELALKSLNAHLEQRVLDRTSELDHSNQELLLTMRTLELAHEELIQSEKLASLGSLVAGIAHELNTPLGNALLSASTMAEVVEETRQIMTAGSLKKSVFDHFLRQIEDGTRLTQRSLERAVCLISSFKQVAVDQSSERRRSFDLSQVLTEVIETLQPNFKHRTCQLITDLPSGILLDSYPGPLGQVVINLTTNAMTHAFDGQIGGTIRVSAERLDSGDVRVSTTDDGVGILPEHLAQVFDPFFTTKLGHGGSGLGLSICHRIVTKILGGQINVQSVVGQGTCFEIILPVNAPEVIA